MDNRELADKLEIWKGCRVEWTEIAFREREQIQIIKALRDADRLGKAEALLRKVTLYIDGQAMLGHEDAEPYSAAIDEYFKETLNG